MTMNEERFQEWKEKYLSLVYVHAVENIPSTGIFKVDLKKAMNLSRSLDEVCRSSYRFQLETVHLRRALKSTLRRLRVHQRTRVGLEPTGMVNFSKNGRTQFISIKGRTGPKRSPQILTQQIFAILTLCAGNRALQGRLYSFLKVNGDLQRWMDDHIHTSLQASVPLIASRDSSSDWARALKAKAWKELQLNSFLTLSKARSGHTKRDLRPKSKVILRRRLEREAYSLLPPPGVKSGEEPQKWFGPKTILRVKRGY